MSFTATLNSSMPQGNAPFEAANWSAPSHSSPSSSARPQPDTIALSKDVIAGWVKVSTLPPSQDLMGFLSVPMSDFRLDPNTHPTPEPARRRTRRGAVTDDAPAKIPRPPNAFMIFRSDLIKDVRVGLQKLEKKQQNLSVIAGEIWNLMPEEFKQGWRTKAMNRLREHQDKHPQYKYTPKQRNGRGKKAGKEESPGFADPAVREQWRAQWPEPFRGPAPPPSRPRRRGAQPYEAPSPRERAGPSSAVEEPQWNRLAMPPRSSSNPSEECYSPPTLSLTEHMASVYSRPPTALPRSAHSSPGSTHSAPPYFPSEHDLSGASQIPQYDMNPPMASLLEPLASSSAFGPMPRARSEPTVADIQNMSSSIQDFTIPQYLEYNTDALGLSDLDMRGNFNYGTADVNSWSNMGTQGLADIKPDGNIFNTELFAGYQEVFDGMTQQQIESFLSSSQPAAHTA